MFYHVFSTKVNPGGASIHGINKLASLKPFLVNLLLHEIKLLNIPSDTRALALHPSLPIQLNLPVAPIRLTAFISSATSWSDAKRITPEIKRNVSYYSYISYILLF